MKSMFISILMSFILLVACKKDKTPLTIDINDPFTSHEYEWQIDTLKAPDALQIQMRGIWGNNENNIWAVGHSDDARYQLWHWDGNDWENIRLLFSGHPHSHAAIHGFSEDDIWIVGTDYQNYPNTKFRSFIIHFDGSEWKLIDEIDAPWCTSVWGTSSYNLFVGSDSGLVLHYDGINWEKQSTNTRSQILDIWGFSENEIYAAGSHHGNIQPIDSTFYYFYKYNDGTWEILQSFLNYPFAPQLPFGIHIWGNQNSNLYSVGADGLYQYSNKQWNPIGSFESLRAIHGSNWNNIFVGGFGNQLYHFNGNDWYLYEQFLDSSKWILSIWVYKNGVFLAGAEANHSLIYRGIRVP